MSKSLKIGLVLPTVSGYSETFIISKIKGLLKHGYSVIMFVNHNNPSKSDTIQIPIYTQTDISRKFHLPFILCHLIITHPIVVLHFIKYERNANRNWLSIVKHLILNSHILNKKLDWLHFGFATMGIQRENVAKAIGAKSAVSFRGFDIGLYPHQHWGCYNLLWKTIDKVHTISDDLYQKALDLGLDPKTSYQKITPAINMEFFKSGPLNNLHDPLRILTVGRLHWIKGYEYILKALNSLKELQISFEYHIAGDGNYREAIVFAIHQLHLTEKVTLLGEIPHEEVKNQMEWADLYVQPSIQEGFCNSVLEAKAMGLLTIVTKAEGLVENVLHKETGWVVQKRSAKKIADQIIKINNLNSVELDKIREQAIQHTKSNNNLHDQIIEWDKFYTN